MSPSIVEVIALALWLGAGVFLSAVVAPALFSVLPSRTLAGAVVGLTLPVLFYAGIAVAIFVIALQVAARGNWAWQTREVAAIVMIVACAAAQFVVAPKIARLRDEIGGPIESVALDDPRRVAFGRLHGISVAWLGVAMLAAATAATVAARAAHVERTH